MPAYTDSFWISSSGKIIDVGVSHINAVRDNPKKFGITQDYIDELYKKHKERPGLEGKAREEILTTVIKKGWMRARENRRSLDWTIQVWKFGNREQLAVLDFVVFLIEKRKSSRHTGIMILELSRGNRMISSSVDAVMKGELSEQMKKSHIKDLIEFLSDKFPSWKKNKN